MKKEEDNIRNNDPELTAYRPETADELYADLKGVLALLPECSAFYTRLGSLYAHILSENTSDCRITLTGSFAKTDYLLREGHAKATLVKAVNNMRVRLLRFRKGEMPEEEMRETTEEDIQALAQFIAFLYDEPIPEDIAARRPQGRVHRAAARLMGDCVRMIVETWDGEYIYGITEQDGIGRIKLRYAKEKGRAGSDWSHLQPLLSAGTQLNLVRPWKQDDAVHAELIVFEPDWLVDISQVAACMEDYGDSPLVYMLRQLEPMQQSEALMLGNLAGQMLDEELHESGGERPYAETAKAFFLHNPFAILSTACSPDFHARAQEQRQNIRQAIREDLPTHVGAFDKGKVMVEPSFFSQMLGLQGRMDFLQLDHRLVIEQKSGKGAYVPGDGEPGIPKAQRQHYAQLLMYMAVLRYNCREQYEANNRELQAFLLYSKYASPLVGVGFAPELLLHCMRLRNQLVWHQMRLAEGGFDILGRITAGHLNRNHTDGPLWRHFQQPKIESLLSAVRCASPLEQAYYYRMLAFVAKEHMLAKLGNKSKEGSGFASIWLDSLEDKLAAGNIYHRLRLLSPSQGDCGRVDRVELRFEEDESHEMSNFRTGDIVILYSYVPGEVPDATRGMVFRCAVLGITADTITLSLRRAQTDAYVFLRHADRYWAVEHDFYESSSSAPLRGLHSFLSAPQERRDLLLLQRHPRVDTTLSTMGSYGRFGEMATRVLQARELFLIIGPPGTGKTSYGMLYTLEEELLHEGTCVLVMSYTNRAVDEICGKLAGRTDFIRIGNAVSCPDRYRPFLLSEKMKACRGKAGLESLIHGTRVFVGTTTAVSAAMELLGMKSFSLAIVDEASQILEPHLVGILSAVHDGAPSVGRVVMIGDHKQLPAVVAQSGEESAVDEPLLREIGLRDCRLSLFERLLSRYADDPGVTYMLTRQGRMHRDIADFPNRMFYGGRLQTVPLPHQEACLPAPAPDADPLTRLLQTRRVFFLHCPAPKDSPSDKVNQAEADIIAGLAERIYALEDNFDAETTLGIIVPYRNQIATIRGTIGRLGIPALDGITIDTVERYQGSQRRYIIYGFTVQRHYQLKFLSANTFVEDGMLIDRKLNVAMTRAQEHLIMVGNTALLDLNPLFRNLYTTFLASPERKA